MSPDDAAEFNNIAKSYRNGLQKVAKAAAAGDQQALALQMDRFLRSGYAKMVGVAAAAQKYAKKHPDAPRLTLAEMKQFAGHLDPFKPLAEAVTFFPEPKNDKELRPVFKFGRQRRALFEMCWDALAACTPKFPFDYLEPGRGGMPAAVRQIVQLLQGGKYGYIVKTDVTNCYGSVEQEAVIQSLPLPTEVTKNVILIGENTHIKAPEEVRKLIQEYKYPNTFHNTAARQGLPQGALTSSLVMSRYIHGPLLATTSFVDRLVNYADDVWVTAIDQPEAQDIRQCLLSRYETCPVGALSVRDMIIPTRQFVSVGHYGVRCVAPDLGGGVRISASHKHWEKLKDMIHRMCPTESDAAFCTFMECARSRAEEWRKAFPLCTHDEAADEHFEFVVVLAVCNAWEQREASKKQELL
jgi:hypothetical protein